MPGIFQRYAIDLPGICPQDILQTCTIYVQKCPKKARYASNITLNIIPDLFEICLSQDKPQAYVSKMPYIYLRCA